MSKTFKYHQNPTRIKGTLHEQKYIFLSGLSQLLLE